jgi:exodeoxyribonuclease V alpha subunit
MYPISTTSLTKVFRYGIGGISTVATNTRLRKETIKDNTNQTILGEDKAYVYVNISQDKIIKNVLTLYKKLLETNNPEDISVLTSYNKGDYGTINLNNYLQSLANPKSKVKTESYIKIFDTKFYIDDIIMQNSNNYKAFKFTGDIEDSFKQNLKTFVANGEVGKIVDIDFQKQVALIKFDDATVVYNVKQLSDCRLAYGYTIHKSQGSQNKIIILITPKAHTYMLNSNLLYVGMTRATDRVYHFRELETFNRAVKIKENFDRLTFLQDLLIAN